MDKLTLKIFASEESIEPVVEYVFPTPSEFSEVKDIFNEVASFTDFKYELHANDFHMTSKLHFGNFFIECLICKYFNNEDI